MPQNDFLMPLDDDASADTNVSPEIDPTEEEQGSEMLYTDKDGRTVSADSTQSTTAQSLETETVGKEYSSEFHLVETDVDELYTRDTDKPTAAFVEIVANQTIQKHQPDEEAVPQYEEDGKPRYIVIRARITHD